MPRGSDMRRPLPAATAEKASRISAVRRGRNDRRDRTAGPDAGAQRGNRLILNCGWPPPRKLAASPTSDPPQRRAVISPGVRRSDDRAVFRCRLLPDILRARFPIRGIGGGPAALWAVGSAGSSALWTVVPARAVLAATDETSGRTGNARGVLGHRPAHACPSPAFT